MTTYYRNEYLFSEIYLQEITQQPEDTKILASLTTFNTDFRRAITVIWGQDFDASVIGTSSSV